jgi:hypothetical protein
LQISLLLPHDAVGGDPAGFYHLIDKALADGRSHQARDDKGAPHGDEESEDDVGDDQLSTQVGETAQPAA